MLFGLAHEFQEAWHQLSGPAWREAGSAPEASVHRSDRAQKLEALPDKDGENPVNVQPEDTFNMDESGLYYGQQPVARWREGGLQEIRRTRSA
jgi:hypothetical protein